MKRFCFLFLFFLPFAAIAQTPVKIYGNLGLENVNISVLNTQYGTSTDARGDYSLLLFAKDKPVDLLYSSIGYCDTVVSLIPKALQQDSLNVSFRMREKEYDLPEAGVVANRDFYRTERGRRIADISFDGEKILVLEHEKRHSLLRVLDKEGEILGETRFDTIFEEIHTDCFGDFILIAENTCLQIAFDGENKAFAVSVFPRKTYREKLQNLLFEFNGAYVFRNTTREKYDYYVYPDHSQSQTYFYVYENDTTHEKHLLGRFVDEENMMVCQSYYNEIIAAYYEAVEPMANIIEIGMWDGDLKKLMENPKLDRLVGWYCNVQATEYHTAALKFANFMQFLDLEKYRVVEFGEDFNLKAKHELKFLSNEKHFNGQFITDELTNKTYGVFVKDGIYYVGLYNPSECTVGFTTKASNHIYPDVFKINGGYAYSVHFDKERQIGIINRIKLN